MGISIPYRGVVEIVGEHDVGKTLAALQVVKGGRDAYSKTVFVDDDEKGDGTVKQLYESGVEFERYINIGEYKSKVFSTNGVLKVDDMLSKVIFPIVEEISKSHHELVVYDTWRGVYQAARGHVERNQHQYRDVVTFRGTSSIIQGLISKVAREIEKGIIEKLKASCDVLVMTHHLKDRYENNVKVDGVFVPESSRTISEVCNMRIWLRRNPSSKVPVMLFLKRPVVPKLEKGEVKFVNIVPMKVVPKKEDESIWDAMARYEKNPIESRQPAAEETPNAEELALLSGTLTPDQKSYVREMVKYVSENQEEVSEVAEAVVSKEEKKDGIDGNVDADYPPFPKTAAEFYMAAHNKWGMTAAEVKDQTDFGLDAVMKMGEGEIGELWEALLKLNE